MMNMARQKTQRQIDTERVTFGNVLKHLLTERQAEQFAIVERATGNQTGYYLWLANEVAQWHLDEAAIEHTWDYNNHRDRTREEWMRESIAYLLRNVDNTYFTLSDEGVRKDVTKRAIHLIDMSCQKHGTLTFDMSDEALSKFQD